MTGAEIAAFALVLALYSIASLTALFCLSFESRLRRATVLLAGAGFLSHLTLIGMRVALTGHLPVVGEYENALSFAAAAVMIGLILGARARERMLPILAVILPVSILMMGFAAYRDPNPLAMTAPYRSPWLYVHVAFYLGAFAALAVAAAAAVLAIGRRRPVTASGQDLIRGGLRFGFACQGVGIIAGAIWAHYLWGTYWGWDPIETWSLASWIFLGIVLHLERARILKGNALAWGAILTFLFLFFSIFGVSRLQDTFHRLNEL